MNNLQVFHVSQKALIIENDKCLLLYKEKDGFWELPGGRVDEGEEGMESFARELKEELGIDKFEILGIADYYIWAKLRQRDKIPATMTVFLVKADLKNSIELEEETHTRYRWCNKAEVDKLNFYWPNEKDSIKKGFDFYRKYINRSK